MYWRVSQHSTSNGCNRASYWREEIGPGREHVESSS